MADTNFYIILGVSQDATCLEIKQAYRRLARRFHPDVSREKNAAHKFKQMVEAYKVLADPLKRTSYDRSHCINNSDLFNTLIKDFDTIFEDFQDEKRRTCL